MSKDLYIFAGVNGVGKSTLYNFHIDDEGIKNSVRLILMKLFVLLEIGEIMQIK